MIRSDLRPHSLRQLLFQIAEIVVARRVADVVEEIADHGSPVGRAFHLRVELDAVQPPRPILQRRVGAVVGGRRAGEALRQAHDAVGVAHQTDLLRVQPRKQRGGGVHAHGSPPVLAGGAGGNLAAHRPCQQMPSTGMPSSNISLSQCGESAQYTLFGPPVRMMPIGAISRTAAAEISPARTIDSTPHSRTRRAISSLYCPPKSRISKSSCCPCCTFAIRIKTSYHSLIYSSRPAPTET